MSRGLLLLTAPVVLAAVLIGCNGGGDSAPNAAEFELARDALYQELDSYGANIGFLPDDIRDDLLESCRALDEIAAVDDVDDICTAIAQAVADGDPGLIELVLNELAALTAD